MQVRIQHGQPTVQTGGFGRLMLATLLVGINGGYFAAAKGVLFVGVMGVRAPRELCTAEIPLGSPSAAGAITLTLECGGFDAGRPVYWD